MDIYELNSIKDNEARFSPYYVIGFDTVEEARQAKKLLGFLIAYSEEIRDFFSARQRLDV